MNLHPHKLQSPELNLTPLIDVVFLLLIFFMVSTTFERESQIQVQLPEASDQEMPEELPRFLDITIDRRGHFYINQREVINTDIKTLKRAIEKISIEDKELPVVITADAQTPHQAVMTAMDAASQLGYLRMTFAARLPDGEQ